MSTDYTKNMIERRQRAWHQAKELLDTASKANRGLTATEEASWALLNEEIDTLDNQIEARTEEDTREREAATARSAYGNVFAGGDVRSPGRPSVDNDVLDFLRGNRVSLDLDMRSVAREKALVRAGAEGRELRDLVVDTNASGGYTVPTDFMRQLWDFLEFYSGARQLNVQVLTTDSGAPLQVPKVTTHGTAALKGEGTAFAEADGVFGQVTMHAWKYGVLTQVSYELLTDSGIDALTFVAKDTARAIARATDIDYVTGNGSSKPVGLMTTLTMGATVQAAATGVPSYGNLVDLLYSVNPVARSQGAQWFTLDTNLAKIRKITDSQNRPLWEPSLQVGEPDMLMGYGVVQDPNVTAFATAAGTHMAFGHFGGYLLRDVGQLRFERSDDFAFSSDLVTFRSVLRTDGAWIDATSVRGLKAPTT